MMPGMSASESPEQIAQTLIYPYLNLAVKFLQDEYATGTDIDNGMRFGCGYPVGPLAYLDQVGPGVVRDALAARYTETGDNLHKPVALLDRVADAGSTFHAAGDAGGAATPELRHSIATVGIVGTGTMASGIVQVFAQAGYDVVFVGRGQDKLDGVAGYISKNIDRAIAKGRSTEDDKVAILGRLTGATERSALADVDIVIEAIAEDLAIKTELFTDLDAILKPGAILATTTSSLPITQLAETTQRPGDVIGMHFFNPAPVMKLVEIVTTTHTSPEVDETTRALTTAVGKVGVSCGDRAGFIVNALLFPYLNDAVKLAESGLELGTIDAAIKGQVGLPMGPFELLDVVGNDVSLAIEQELFAEFKEPGLAPAESLEQKVAQGKLGRKTGEGFHTY
jgi:3-hydroxybutyryl-CoA dehydrogenase